MIWGVVLAIIALPGVAALTSPQLRERSIYQVLTDRFARSDGYETPCSTEQRAYCGGTWKGIEQRLDYIQGMGFDTGKPRNYCATSDTSVWISPVVANVPGVGSSESYHGRSRYQSQSTER